MPKRTRQNTVGALHARVKRALRTGGHVWYRLADGSLVQVKRAELARGNILQCWDGFTWRAVTRSTLGVLTILDGAK